MLNIKLAWRLFRREWRSGELGVLMFALWIAISGLSAVTLLVDRIDRGMTKEAAQVLGADQILSSPRAIDAEWVSQAEQFQLQHSSSLWFSSVVVAGEEFNLSTIKAVDNQFPLAGTLLIADEPFAEGAEKVGAPAQGSVWLSPRLMHKLQLKKGDKLQIGTSELVVDGVIISEPGGGSFFNFSPTVMMNLVDVEATNIIQPGSRLNYRLSLSGSEQALADYAEWVRPQLNRTQRLTGINSGAPALGSALGRAKNYLNLSGVLGLLLGAIAIAIAANRYAIRHFDHSALLRCLGVKKNQVVVIFCWVLVFAGALGTIAGIFTGYWLNQILVMVLADVLPSELPGLRWTTLALDFATGMVVLLGFALPALLRIRAIEPMRIFRRELEPMAMSSWLVLALSLVVMGAILFLYAQNLTLVLVLLIGGSLLMAVGLLLSRLLLEAAKKITQGRSMAVRFGVEHLSRHRSASLIQITAFGLTLTLLFTILLLRNELIVDWQEQLPEDAPNHFLVNLQPEDVEGLNEFFTAQSIKSAGLYPMIRGRMVAINDQAPKDVLSEKALKHNTLRRDLNLTWSSQMADSNQLLEGDWSMGANEQTHISVEQKMAKELGLKLGDSLTFDIGGRQVSAPITSIRKVDWDSFEPNFYVIFNDESLKSFPSTYMTSFFLASDRKLLLNDLLERYPTVSIIELDLILKEVRKVFTQASLAVEIVLIFVILTGLAILFATIRATLDDKMYEAALLKTIGANKGFVRKTTLVEYWVLGVLAGGFAALSAQSLALVLYQQVFQITPEFHGWLWFSAPLVAVALIVPAGVWGNQRVLKTPPAQILKEA
ncbi:ABC transporter permease [Pleionea sp. CnH1-48]|uniref:ABC transporter permease n=1 Tax=Pleionea sp. CnH1-48 TaxID=2954494 RepID=UPI002096B79D|nr:FtsX-like permease family protein [Pleionea sp. CnH1-48]MCO7225401.1 FtsX-like permease family protein [Pleionea sp. CnH1-48]